MSAPVSSTLRAAESFLALALGLGLVGLQVLIGGTRLVYSLPVAALFGVAGVLAIFFLRRAQPNASRVCLWSAALFFGYILVRAWFSPVVYLARVDIFSVLAGLIVYLLVAWVLTSAPLRMAILLVLLGAALVQVMVGAIQFRHGNNFMLISFLQRFDYGRRASGFYACPNHFAGLLEVVGIFCLSFAVWARWPIWAKLLVGYAGGVCYAGLALTGSRGGYLSAAAGLTALAILSLSVLSRAGPVLFRRAVLGGGLLALLFLGALFFGIQKSEFLSGRAQNVADTQDIRLDLWRAAVAQWKLAPTFGTGSGTYLFYGRHFRTERVQLDPVETHNDYLQLLAEYGAVGGAAFLLFLGAHLWRGARVFRRLGPRRVALSGRMLSNNLSLNLGALGAVAAYLVHSIFDFNLHIPANVCLLAFVFGLLANPGVGGESQKNSGSPSWFSERLLLPLLGLILLGGALRYGRAEYDAEASRVALRDERHLAALRWAQQAIALDDMNPETFFYLGESRVRRAEGLTQPAARASYYQAAVDPFERALALAPHDETLLIALGRVYDALGRFAEAEWMFGQALAWDPRSLMTQKSYAAHLVSWSRSGMPTAVVPAKMHLPDKNKPLASPPPR